MRCFFKAFLIAVTKGHGKPISLYLYLLLELTLKQMGVQFAE
jgi:hypothetical protein